MNNMYVNNMTKKEKYSNKQQFDRQQSPVYDEHFPYFAVNDVLQIFCTYEQSLIRTTFK